VPQKQPKKGRLWLNDGSCVRLRAEYVNHVWSYDFVHHRTDDGRAFRTLNVLDEFGRECLDIRVKRKLNSTDVIDVLTDLFILRGVACRPSSGLTTDLSSLLKPFASGSAQSGQRPPTSGQAHRGRTDTLKASMPGSAMSF
jgi:hypothetical protein